MDADKVLKRWRPIRRTLRDLPCEKKNGQTLGQLCDGLDMAQQSATQHLGILEAADLVTTNPQAVTYSIRGHAWDTIDTSLQKFVRMPPETARWFDISAQSASGGGYGPSLPSPHRNLSPAS